MNGAMVPAVYPLDADIETEGYDLFIAALGFESRAIAVAQRLGGEVRHKIAWSFLDRQELAFSVNEEYYHSSGFEIRSPPDSDFELDVQRQLAGAEPLEGEVYRIAVDISSFSRFRIASIISALSAADLHLDRKVDFLYTLAQFSNPPERAPANIHVGPVHRFFSGWTEYPEDSLTAIVGLGYEQDRALGAVEHLQVSEVWAWTPRSPIEEYSGKLHEANDIFLEMIPEQRQLTYDVLKPFDAFVSLESLTRQANQDASVVLLPFGPKIFALAAMLVGTVHRNVAVWRVSAGQTEEASDRHPTDHVCGIRAVFPSALVEGRELAEERTDTR